jgi:hypothetical protein
MLSQNLPTPLHLAAKEGNLSAIQELIAQGAPVNATNNHGRTPLFFAAENGHTEAVAELIKHNAEIDTIAQTPAGNYTTPLMVAATMGYEAVVDLLLAKKANTEVCSDAMKRAELIAATNALGFSVTFLSPPSSNISTALTMAIHGNHEKIALKLMNCITHDPENLSHSQRVSMLSNALKHNNEKLAHEILARYHIVDVNGNLTNAHKAVENKNSSLILLLIRNGIFPRDLDTDFFLTWNKKDPHLLITLIMLCNPWWRYYTGNEQLFAHRDALLKEYDISNSLIPSYANDHKYFDYFFDAWLCAEIKYFFENQAATIWALVRFHCNNDNTWKTLDPVNLSANENFEMGNLLGMSASQETPSPAYYNNNYFIKMRSLMHLRQAVQQGSAEAKTFLSDRFAAFTKDRATLCADFSLQEKKFEKEKTSSVRDEKHKHILAPSAVVMGLDNDFQGMKTSPDSKLKNSDPIDVDSDLLKRCDAAIISFANKVQHFNETYNWDKLNKQMEKSVKYLYQRRIETRTGITSLFGYSKRDYDTRVRIINGIARIKKKAEEAPAEYMEKHIHDMAEYIRNELPQVNRGISKRFAELLKDMLEILDPLDEKLNLDSLHRPPSFRDS